MSKANEEAHSTTSGIYIVTNDREFEDPNGRMTFTLRYLDDDPEQWILTGLLQTTAFITKLMEIHTDRYSIQAIEILAADFGSHSNDIVYNFRAKGFECYY